VSNFIEMASTEQIRNNLITKLLAIRNKDILAAIDRLLVTTIKEEDLYKTSERQKLLLKASELDIQNGDLFLDEEIKQEEDLWLSK
jgi:hypothetical protein